MFKKHDGFCPVLRAGLPVGVPPKVGTRWGCPKDRAGIVMSFYLTKGLLK
jgi:hypothetical protein